MENIPYYDFDMLFDAEAKYRVAMLGLMHPESVNVDAIKAASGAYKRQLFKAARYIRAELRYVNSTMAHIEESITTEQVDQDEGNDEE